MAKSPYTNLLTTAHFAHSGLIDDWLHGSSVESMKELGLRKYIGIIHEAIFYNDRFSIRCVGCIN